MSGLAYRHQRVQRLRRLVGRRAVRQQEGCFVLEGTKLLEEALASGAVIEAVYVDGQWARQAPAEGADAEVGPEASATGPRLAQLLGRCYDAGTRVFELEDGVLARVAGTVTPQPVMAVVQVPSYSLTDLGAARPELVVVCVDVRDPGNAGTVARSAWAAGADAVLCCEGTVDPWNPKSVRASAGAVLHVPVLSAGPAPEVLAQVGGWGLRRWGSVPEGGTDYAAADFSEPTALVLGNEAAGLSLGPLEGHLDGLVSIPMAGAAESLNVGMAAAVLCFEVTRQRRVGPGLGRVGQA